MIEQAMQYALAKQVPAMGRGFVISTAYGDITVPEGALAERIQQQVRTALTAAFLAPQRSQGSKP